MAHTVKAQIRVALGTVEVTDTDRRAIACLADTALPEGSRRLAARDECRAYLREHGQAGLAALVSRFLSAGGRTASMESMSAAERASLLPGETVPDPRRVAELEAERD